MPHETTAIQKAIRPNRDRTQPLSAASLPDALLKMNTVCAVTGLSPSSIYRKTATGEFVTPVRLGARCTRWRAADVRNWMAAQTTQAEE